MPLMQGHSWIINLSRRCDMWRDISEVIFVAVIVMIVALILFKKEK